MKRRWRAKFSTYDGDKRILAGEVFESETDWSGVFPCLGTIREDMGKEGEEIKKKLDEIYERGIKEMEKEAERKAEAEDDEILEEDKAEAEKLAEEISEEKIETKSEIEAVIDKIKVATTARGRKRKAEKQ